MRQRFTRQNVMLSMAFLMLGFIIGVLAYRFGDQKDVIVTFLTTLGGTCAGWIGCAFQYEWGSSRGSADKTDLLAKAAPVGGGG
jgi:hypothetical protein